MTAYATVSEIKEHATDIQFGDDYDVLLSALAERASRLIDRLLKRDEGAFAVTTATARWYTSNGGTELAIDECVEITEVACRFGSGTDLTVLSSTDYIAWPYNGPPYYRLDIDRRQGSYPAWPNTGPQSVRVTAKWGYSTDPPQHLKEAVIIQVLRWFRRGQQMFADVNLAGASMGVLSFAKELDPDVKTILASIPPPLPL